MGSVLAGGSNTSTSTQAPPPQVLANYQGLVNRATGVANTPYTAYPGEQVAPLSNQTQQGLGGVNQYAGAAQPYLQEAGQMTQAAAAPVTPTAFSGDQVSQYENPFTSDVIDATQAEFNNQNEQQAQFLNSQNIGAGAFGGDRAGISQDILANQQNLAQAPVIAGLNQSNYNQALAEFNNQQQTDLGAQEFSNSMAGQMGAQYGNIGTGIQNAGMSGANAQLQAGMIPQAEQQATDTALQTDWNTGQAYPFQTTDFLGNIIEGTGTNSGGTSSSTQPGPSALGQIAGLGTAALGAASNPAVTSGLGSLGSSIASALPFLAAARGGRITSDRENVRSLGKTFDGQDIHSFNFKGDPRTHFDSGGSVSPGQIYDLGVGKAASPAGALALMDPNSGAGAGTGKFGAGSLSMTPAGTLMQRTPAASQWTSGPGAVQPGWGGGAGSPMNPLPAGPMAGARGPSGPLQPGPMVNPQQVPAARGGRIGRADGGTAIGGGAPQMSGFATYGYLDDATPAAIAQGYGVPSPLSGLAQILNSTLTGGATGGGNVPPTAYTQIGSESLSPSLPNHEGAAPGTIFNPINFTDPTQNTQTSAAANSVATANQVALRGLAADSMGPNASVGSNPPGGGVSLANPAASAAGPPVSLVPPASGSGSSAPAASSSGSGAQSSSSPSSSAWLGTPINSITDLGGPNYVGPTIGGGWSGTPLSQLTPNQQAWAAQQQGVIDQIRANPGNSVALGHTLTIMPSKADGGRIGRQDGGGLGSLSFYTPETGNARAAHYNPAISPLAPPPTPQSIYTPPHIAPHRAHPRAQVPLPPPRPMTPQPPPPQSVASAPAPVSLPPLNPDETKDPFVHYPDASFPQPSSPHPTDPDPDRESGLDKLRALLGGGRPGFNMGGANAGVMGQMPLQGAIGYAPQGQGVTGMDSQGSGMGAGSTAKKAAGFDGLFGSGFKRGGRIGRAVGGGLGGLGMDPSQANDLTALLASIGAPLPMGPGVGIPNPPQPKSQNQSAGSGLSGLGSALSKWGNAQPSQGGLGSLDASDFADISAAGPDMSTIADDAFNGFRSGGGIRPGFADGGEGEGATGTSGMGSSVSIGGQQGTAPSGQGGIGSDAAATGDEGGPAGGGSSAAAAAAAAASAAGGGAGQGGAGGGGGGGGVSAGPSGGGGGGGSGAASSSGGAGGGGPGGGAGGGGHGGGAGGVGTNATSPAQAALAQTLAAIAKFGNQISIGNPFGGLFGSPAPAHNSIALDNALNHALAQRGSQATFGDTPGQNVSTQSLLGQPTDTVAHLLGQLSLGNMGQFGQGVSSMGFPAGNPSIGIGGIQGTPAPFGTLGPAHNFGETTTSPAGVATVANPGNSSESPAQQALDANSLASVQAMHAAPTAPASPTGVATALAPGQPSNAPNSMIGMLAAPATAQALMGQLATPAPATAPAPAGLGSVANAVGASVPQVGGGGRGFGLGGIVRHGFLDGGDTSEAEAPPTAPVAAPAPFTPPTRQQVLDYNAQIAPKYGNKPDVVSKVLTGEMGAKDPYQVGDAGSSFGPWQLHEGGVNPAMNHPGMGDDYKKATGHDPNDPHYWQEQSDFAQQGMSKQGLTPWATTMGKLGLGKWSAREGGEPDGGGVMAYAGADQNQQQQQDLTHADPETQINAAMEDAGRAPDKKQLQSDFSMALMQAGFGMMASRSSHPGVAIGEGAMAGMKYLQTQRQLDNEWMKNNAQIQEYASEARYRDQMVNASVNNMNIERAKITFATDYANWVSGGEVGSAPKLTLPPMVGGSAAPSAAAAPVQPSASVTAQPPAAQPPASSTAASPPIPVTPGAVVAPKTAANAPPAPVATPPAPNAAQPPSAPPAPPSAPPAAANTQLAQDPDWQKGQKLIAQGKSLNGVAAGMGDGIIAQGDALVKGAESRFAPTLKGQEEASGKAATQRSEENEEVADRVPQVQTEVQSLEALRELMKRVPTGWATTNFAEAQNVLATFGIHVGDPAAVREFIKYTTSDIWQNLKEQKGAVRNKEMDAASKMNVDPDAPPAANAEIIAKQLGLARLQLQYAKEYRDWDKANPTTASPTGFKTDWMLKNDLGKFVEGERKNIAYPGQAVPAKGQYEPGQLYRLKNGRFARGRDKSTLVYED